MPSWIERGVKSAFLSLLDVPVSDEFAARFATQIARAATSDGKTPMAEIIAATEGYSGIPSWQIMGQSRKAPIAEARQMAMAHCYAAGHSLSAIGRKFERDHTTVLHAVRKFARPTPPSPGENKTR